MQISSNLTFPNEGSDSARDQDVLVKVENVGKIFCRDLKKSLFYGLKDSLREMIPWAASRAKGENGDPPLRAGEFWANRGISFELRRGECLGLIGRNGAGKTTLLKMLNGLIKPDTGSIEMHGRVGALIALGAGFNPILTGRENIYVNGSVLGLTRKEIDEKIDGIIEFAEIREFIDSPVQSYSSGMQVRLGFAVATALSPDVLILDEVLAVGDVAFRHKCYHRIQQLKSRAAVILVSHNMEQIGNVANRALVVNKGEVAMNGTVNEAIECYEELNATDFEKESHLSVEVSPPIVSLVPLLPDQISTGGCFEAILKIECAEPLEGVFVRAKIVGPDEVTAAEISTSHQPISFAAGHCEVRLRSEKLFLRPSVYTIRMLFQREFSPAPLAVVQFTKRLVVSGAASSRKAYYQVPASLEIGSVI